MIKRINHVGMSVPNLERSIEFYCKAFGMEIVGQSAFEPGTEDGRYAAILGLEGATGRVASIRSARLNFELFEFAHPIPKRGDLHRSVCDHGITHYCIEVTEIDVEYERLKALGASFHCPPLRFFGKAKATYGRDPDGNAFELIEMTLANDSRQAHR